MRKASFITACNPGNMGMYTVDRTIIDLFGNSTQNIQIYSSHPPFKAGYYKLKRCGIDIGHRKKWMEGIVAKQAYLNPNQLKDSERIVFWGDFTLNPEYGVNDFFEHDERFGYKSSKAESINRWRQMFSTTNFSKSKVMTFGQNFQHESLKQEGNFYNEAKSMLKDLSIALPRDSISHFNLKSLDLENCCHIQACDPAMLKVINSKVENSENHFVYYFSRSNIANASELIALLEKNLKLKPIELENWNYYNENFEDRWKVYEKLISTSCFVLTDTYHCAVNSISLKKIPIVISNQSTLQSGTLGDFKKKILLDDCNLSEYLFETDKNGILNTDKTVNILESANSLNNMNDEELIEKFFTVKNLATNAKQILFDFLNIE